MNSLFHRLYSLMKKSENNALEDFLTEIFAEIFEDDHILTGFVERFLHHHVSNPTNIGVSTQKTYPKLSYHAIDSRPDLVITYKDQDPVVIFFENKLDSYEGIDQLSRYADHLGVYQKNGCKTFLVYITRRHEPKKEADIFQSGVTAEFVQIRWYEIYNWLQRFSSNGYIRKMMDYMEELELNETRRFVPQDIYALQQMNRIQSMMDACLDGVVDEEMNKYFGRPIGWSNRNVQLRDFNRYVKCNEQKNGIWIGCGFYFHAEEYPTINIYWEVNPNSSNRDDIIKVMKDFVATHPDWKSNQLEDSTSWSNISLEVSLLTFLHEEDHISAIQKHMINALKQLYTMKQQYSDLGWK